MPEVAVSGDGVVAGDVSPPPLAKWSYAEPRPLVSRRCGDVTTLFDSE
jgi:hypothetical protein